MNRKAARGLAHLFAWAPKVLPKTGADAPVLTISHPDGDITKTLAPIRASVAVTATDGSQAVTLAEAVGDSAAGLTGDEGGAAWLDLGEHGRFPVRVRRFTSSTVAELADRLPHAVGTGATGTLSWNTWEASLSAAEVGADTNRRVKWSIAFTEDRGTDRAGRPDRQTGLLDIVPQPFETGLTDDDVLAVVPGLREQLPPEQHSFGPQRRRALRHLVNAIRKGLPGEHTEDDVSGPQFVEAHANLAAAFVLSSHTHLGFDRGDIDGLRDTADEMIEAALDDLEWLDDGDGEVESGETGVGVGDSYVALQARSHMTPAAGAEPGTWPPADFTRRGINDAL